MRITKEARCAKNAREYIGNRRFMRREKGGKRENFKN